MRSVDPYIRGSGIYYKQANCIEIRNVINLASFHLTILYCVPGFHKNDGGMPSTRWIESNSIVATHYKF